MEQQSSMLLDISILFRCTQKYFERMLHDFNINASQLLFLLLIYENEGINMQELAIKGCFDKGTITKSIQKLEEQGLVHIVTHEKDRRVRKLYSTDITKDIISKAYLIRREWWEQLTSDMSNEEANMAESLLAQLSHQAQHYNDLQEENTIAFFGLQKLTLLDYPQKIASTLFTGGCNFRCPFCHNRDLVFLAENTTQIPLDDVLAYLQKRRNILEGVCISGGEPLLHEGLATFLNEIHEMGFLIKLDTNGSFPERLKSLVEAKLVDYVAMDIKNSPEHYAQSIGIANYDLSAIKDSVSYLLEGHVPYEFRTTIVKELHNKEDMISIGKWIQGADAYYLQSFEDGDTVIQRGLHAHDKHTLEEYKELLIPYVSNTHIRGIQ